MKTLRMAVFAVVTVGILLLVVDGVLSLLLHRSLLPSAMSSAIHGTSLYTRLVGDALPTREPGLDVTYEVDRERFGDLVKMGLVAPGSDSGDGIEQVRLRTDARGFRSVEDHEDCDVVILGDSVSEASNLGEDGPYPLRLDRRMPERICNLSIAAVGTLQQRDHLRLSGLTRKPRVVLLSFFEGNDLEDNENFVDMRRWIEGQSAVRGFLRRRPLLRLARSALDLRGEATPEPPPGSAVNPVRGRIGETELELAFYDSYIARLARPATEIETSRAYRLTLDLLDEILEDCRAAGVPLVVAYFPSKPHVYGSFLREFADPGRLAEFASEREGESPQEFLQRLERNSDTLRSLLHAFCHERGVPFVDLLPALEAAALSGRKIFLTYDTHMSAAGHEVVADVLEAGLARLLSGEGADYSPGSGM